MRTLFSCEKQPLQDVCMLAGCIGANAIPLNGIVFLPVEFMVYLRWKRPSHSRMCVFYFERMRKRVSLADAHEQTKSVFV